MSSPDPVPVLKRQRLGEVLVRIVASCMDVFISLVPSICPSNNLSIQFLHLPTLSCKGFSICRRTHIPTVDAQIQNMDVNEYTSCLPHYMIPSRPHRPFMRMGGGIDKLIVEQPMRCIRPLTSSQGSSSHRAHAAQLGPLPQQPKDPDRAAMRITPTRGFQQPRL